LGVKTLHGHKVLHTARQDTLAERNTTALSRNMTMAHLAQLRVARYFIRKMCPCYTVGALNPYIYMYICSLFLCTLLCPRFHRTQRHNTSQFQSIAPCSAWATQ
jgi:hypothetical protein